MKNEGVIGDVSSDEDNDQVQTINKPIGSNKTAPKVELTKQTKSDPPKSMQSKLQPKKEMKPQKSSNKTKGGVVQIGDSSSDDEGTITTTK